MINKEKVALVKDEVENYTRIPDSLYETGLSFGAAGLFVAWLSRYQRGEQPRLEEVVRDDRTTEPSELERYVSELLASGIMPDTYQPESLSSQGRVNAVLAYLHNGVFCGDHHKAAQIDHIVRILTGCPDGEENEAYRKFVADYQNGEYGPDTYEWDKGIPG